MNALKNIILACSLLVFSSACTVERATLTPAQAVTMEQAEQELAAAEASGDPVAIAAAEAKMDQVEAAIIQEKTAPLVSALTMVPGVGWIAGALGPAAIALAPMFGKRGRKHAKNAVDNLNPFKGGSVNLAGAIQDVLKYAGIKHSSEASAKAADA